MKLETLMYVGLVMILLFGITNATASQSSLGTFKQFECIDLLQTCATCTYNNISSVTYPNSSQILGEVEMVKSGTEYSYNFCDNKVSGRYFVNGYGDIDGIQTTWNYYYDVTPSGGPENNTTLFLIMAISALVLIILSFIFKNYIFAFFSGLLFGTAGVYTMIYGFGFITSQYTRMFSFILIGLGLVIVVVSGLEFMEEMYGEDRTDTYSGEEDED